MQTETILTATARSAAVGATSTVAPFAFATAADADRGLSKDA